MDIKAYIESGIIENYLLGNTSQEENSILECISKNNSEVKSAMLELQNTLEILADSNAVAPPPELKSQIFAKLDFADNSSKENSKPIVNNTAPVQPLNVEPIRQEISPKKSSVSTWLAAASIVLLMAFGWTTYKNQQIEKSLVAAENKNSVTEKEVEFLANQNNMLLNANKIQLNGVEKHPGIIANIYWNSSEVYLESGNLPVPPEGKQYQLWAIVDGKPVDLGLYVDDGKKVHSMKPVKNAQAFAITLEKKGGSENPTMEDMMVMGEV